jgi:hypothetical protein
MDILMQVRVLLLADGWVASCREGEGDVRGSRLARASPTGPAASRRFKRTALA